MTFCYKCFNHLSLQKVYNFSSKFQYEAIIGGIKSKSYKNSTKFFQIHIYD